MVRVDVGIGHRYKPPSALAEQPDVDVRIDRRVNNDRLGL